MIVIEAGLGSQVRSREKGRARHARECSADGRAHQLLNPWHELNRRRASLAFADHWSVRERREPSAYWTRLRATLCISWSGISANAHRTKWMWFIP